MSIKKRRISLTAVAGAAEGEVGLGAKYGRVVRVEVLETGADTSSDVEIVDNSERPVFAIASIDFTTKKSYNLTPEAAKTEDGTDATANAGFGGVVAESPLTVSLANAGTNAAVIDVFVEV